MLDPVYVININKGKPLFAGICPRDVAVFWLNQYPQGNIKVAELDPKLKSEYAEFLVKSR